MTDSPIVAIPQEEAIVVRAADVLRLQDGSLAFDRIRAAATDETQPWRIKLNTEGLVVVWSDKVWSLPAAQAARILAAVAAELQPKDDQELCGWHHGRFCIAPKGHNMGRVDLPEYHHYG